jgi:hypothetical protein
MTQHEKMPFENAADEMENQDNRAPGVSAGSGLSGATRTGLV